jgi:hypothetical protein
MGSKYYLSYAIFSETVYTVENQETLGYDIVQRQANEKK